MTPAGPGAEALPFLSMPDSWVIRAGVSGPECESPAGEVALVLGVCFYGKGASEGESFTVSQNWPALGGAVCRVSKTLNGKA